MKKYTTMALLYYPDTLHNGRENWYTGAVTDGLSVVFDWRPSSSGRYVLAKFDSVDVPIFVNSSFSNTSTDSSWPYLFSINADCRIDCKEKLEFLQYNNC